MCLRVDCAVTVDGKPRTERRMANSRGTRRVFPPVFLRFRAMCTTSASSSGCTAMRKPRFVRFRIADPSAQSNYRGYYACDFVGGSAHFIGSLGHEVDDANSFAEWGADYLKFVECFKFSVGLEADTTL